jgi:membrane associated rhomboid family serine protease
MGSLKQLWNEIKRVPQPTIFAIIVVMTLIFLVEEVFGASFESFVAVPARITHAWSQILSGESIVQSVGTLFTLVSAVFLHGGFDHILMNMVFLWTFGSLTAQNVGRWNAVWILLVTGVVGNIAQVCLGPHRLGGILGASGAITGFEGVYVALSARWQLNWPNVWPLAHPVPPMQLVVFALVGVGIDVYRLMDQQIGIAFGAHIGGFVCGFLIGTAFTLIWPTKASYVRKSKRVTNRG